MVTIVALKFAMSSHFPLPKISPSLFRHAQSLFLFQIVLGANLIHFFDGKSNIELGAAGCDHLSWVFNHSSSGSRHLEIVGTKREKFFGNGKCELIANFSARMVTI